MLRRKSAMAAPDEIRLFQVFRFIPPAIGAPALYVAPGLSTFQHGEAPRVTWFQWCDGLSSRDRRVQSLRPHETKNNPARHRRGCTRGCRRHDLVVSPQSFPFGGGTDSLRQRRHPPGGTRRSEERRVGKE